MLRFFNPDRGSGPDALNTTKCRMCGQAEERYAHFHECAPVVKLMTALHELWGLTPDRSPQRILFGQGLTPGQINLWLLLWKQILLHFTNVDIGNKVPFGLLRVWADALIMYRDTVNGYLCKVQLQFLHLETIPDHKLKTVNRPLTPTAEITPGKKLIWSAKLYTHLKEAELYKQSR